MAEDKKPKDSALSVNQGIEQPAGINEAGIRRLRSSRPALMPAAAYVQGILQGDRTILSRAITLVESARPDHQQLAQEVIEACLPHAGHSIRVGITGVPGVGKSTFIESLGNLLIGEGKKLAVLAIDPSSNRSKGSILGDKTRMETLANAPQAFIRPSPSAGSLGGVARKTRESIILCEAAGFDTLFVETVGVGQSETAVHSMVDFFLLLMLAGAGDELQGIKRGIMEMADGIVINKADGDNLPAARRAQAEYANALHLFPPTGSGWAPRVSLCSSLNGEGVAEAWSMIMSYRELTVQNGWFHQKRKEQDVQIMHGAVEQYLSNSFLHHPKVREMLPQYEQEIIHNRMSAYVAAQRLIAAFEGKAPATPAP